MRIGLAKNNLPKSTIKLPLPVYNTLIMTCLILPAMAMAEIESIQSAPAQSKSGLIASEQIQAEASEAIVPESDSAGVKQAENNAISLEELRRLIEQQRKSLEEQQRKIENQEKQLEQQRLEIAKQRESMKSHVGVLNSLQTQLDQLAMKQGEEPAMSEEDKLMLSRLQILEEQVAAIPEDPSLSMEIQPGAIPLPGTNASLKIGGFVKASFIKSFDSVDSVDRFIVGKIPVTDANEFAHDKSDISAAQTRLNLDLREKTSVGSLRAFVEGDFKGSGDTFRLRHAYGQFRDILAGKTWSVFYDPVAHPQELDFEGVNGQVIVRNAQIRYFPSIGKAWDLSVAIESPDAEIGIIDFDTNEVTEAEGVSEQPDFTFSIRRNFDRFSHVKLSGIIRQVSARSVIRDKTESELGWGLNLSGVIKFPKIDERDNLKWQLTYGDGIGRYINDLNSVGGMDGVFDPQGKIKTLPVVAGYAAYQHWWTDKTRSSFLISGVWVDNYSFQPDDSYYKTERISGNITYSPVPRFDLGVELIWGRRTNEDRKSGDAIQALLIGQFRF